MQSINSVNCLIKIGDLRHDFVCFCVTLIPVDVQTNDEINYAYLKSIRNLISM